MSDNNDHQSILKRVKEVWPELNIFERFEYLISLIMMVLICIVIVIALIRLGKNVYVTLVVKALDPLDFNVFQMIFGNILTLYIAMEFRHSIQGVLYGQGHILQTRTILLIAMLAIARKFIVMDKTTSPEVMAALAFILVSLGATYWILKAAKTKRIDIVGEHSK